jgi:hypothetical protein
MGSQSRAANPLLSPPPIPMGSQSRAPNPLGAGAPPSTGNQFRVAVPVGPPTPIPTASQARAQNPLRPPTLGSAPSPSALHRQPSVIVSEDLQPASDKVPTDKRIALGLAQVSEPATPAAQPALLDEEMEEVSDDSVVPMTDTHDDEEGLEEAEAMEEAEEVPADDPAHTLDPSSTLGALDEEPPEAEAEAMEGDSHDIEPLSALDPWLAQLVHGWCPPDAGLFSRLPPPTTFPGRENPPPSRP